LNTGTDLAPQKEQLAGFGSPWLCTLFLQLTQFSDHFLDPEDISDTTDQYSAPERRPCAHVLDPHQELDRRLAHAMNNGTQIPVPASADVEVDDE